MDPNSYLSTLSTRSEQIEGEMVSYETLDLQLTDTEIARIIGNRVEQAEGWWNSNLNLKNVRDGNEKYWLNDSIDVSELYDFQVPYKDPKIFVAIETLIPMALAKPPQPLVTESEDSDAARELAQDLSNVLLGKYDDLYIKTKLIMIARHLLVGYRVGVMKYGFDDAIGMMDAKGATIGDVTVETLRPHTVVISENTKNHDKIPLVGEYKRDSVEELCHRFEAKKDEIYKEMGISSGVSPKLGKDVGYIEVHFSYRDKSGKPNEGITWKLGNVVMGGTKTPYWNYTDSSYDEKGNQVPTNFFQKPQKPYVFFNYLNLGKHLYDDTSLTEQSANAADIVNKRGRQIVENADSANGGLVFNSGMISQESVAKLIGDPREKVMVNGDVRMAVTRVPNTQLEPYVLEDKQDARAVIDNVFSTHGAIRGEVTQSNTLGQDVLSQRGDTARITTLSNALEDGMDRVYKGLTQVMKVFFTDAQKVSFTTPDGANKFVNNFSSNSIVYGTKIKVKEGSALPEDPTAKKQETIQMMAVLDPLSIAEGLNKPQPKEFAKRLFLYRAAPDKYYTDVLGESLEGDSGQQDPSAVQEQQVMMTGQEVPPQSSPSKAHLATHDAWLNSPQFQQAAQQNPQVQQIAISHVKAENQNAKVALKQPDATQPQDASAQPEQGMLGANPAQPQGQPPPAQPQQPTGASQQPKGVMSRIAGLFGGG